jgi:hypothetical protein
LNGMLIPAVLKKIFSLIKIVYMLNGQTVKYSLSMMRQKATPVQLKQSLPMMEKLLTLS